MEGKFHLDIGQTGLGIDGVAGVRMPVQHRIDPLETALAHHVSLAAAPFFGRAAEQADSPGMPLGQVFRNGDRSGHRPHA